MTVSTNSIDAQPKIEERQKLNEEEENKMVSTSSNEVGTWAQLAESLYDFLNRRNTTIDYTLVDMEVMVPRSTGSDAPQAPWKFNGAMRLRTWEG